MKFIPALACLFCLALLGTCLVESAYLISEPCIDIEDIDDVTFTTVQYFSVIVTIVGLIHFSIKKLNLLQLKTYWKNRAFRYSDTFDIFQKCHNIGGIIVVCTSNVSRRCLLRRVPLCDIRCILELSLPSNPFVYHSHDRKITG